MKYLQKINAVLLGLGISSSVVPVALADDTEIYTQAADAAAASNPNIMFIVDTSGSMGSSSATLVKPFYDPSDTYTANKAGTTSCISTAVYFTEDGIAPDCSQPLTNYFNYSALECDHAIIGYEADDQLDNAGNLIPYGGKITPGQDGALLLVGTYSDQLAQYDDDATPPRWRELSIGTSSDRDFAIECFSDNGNTTANGNNDEFIIDNGGDGYTGTEPADLDNPHPVWTGGAGNLQLFSGNYINYKNWEPADADLVSKTRLEQVQHAVDTMVRGNTRVDIGLMRFDGSNNNASNGGSVAYPILDVGEDRNDFFTRLGNLDAGSYTPISETYYEALLYFGGRSADFSLLSNPGNQVVADTMMPGNTVFRSPITGTCDKNYIVMLSDGVPKKDDLNNDRQLVLPGFPAGSCSTNITSSTNDDNRDSDTDPGFASTVDNCFDELSLWANTNDVLQVANPDNPGADVGVQTIVTHTIGFQIDPNAEALMTSAAENGGGEANFAESADDLVAIFDKLIAQALDVNTTFSSPAVSVNAFNRNTHLDDLYFTLFRPEYTKHWPGNLKKYKLKFYEDVNDDDGDGDTTEHLPFIAGSDNLNAVDPSTGFFSDTAKSFWSATTDGSDVRLGGAVSVFDTSRNVYTYTGDYTDNDGVDTPASGVLTTAANAVAVSNTALNDALLGTTSLSDKFSGTPYRTTLINWAKGLDALSDYGVTDTFDDARPEMGDPLHSEPALVQYGGTPAVPDLVIYTATNDGYLHAFSSITGAEYFSFIPQELLLNLKTLMENPDGEKIYGLDGSVVAWITDANNDSDIESSDGDSVIIYFSMRRGGKNIYAMDVTDRTAPSLLWVIKGGEGDYEELGDTWSTINVEKIKDGSTEKTVLIFGGGYDESQDTALVRTPDSEGRAVFIADATTGERLWIGADDGDTDIDEMDYSIPARVKPLDITGDGYIDRLYVADMGGQLFRFDIDNTNGNALSDSITGARIADLAGSDAIDARRFYYPPDVALIVDESGKYNALVIGSGYRAHPLNTTIHDRIYMVKDKQIGFTTSYTTDVEESDLKDVTLNVAGGDGADDAARDAELLLIQGADGWFINLDDETNSGTWIGEKVLAEPLLVEGVAVVTTYTPNMLPANNACGPPLGVGKVFFLDIVDATPAFPANTDLRDQRHTGTTLAQPGIPSTPHFNVPEDETPCILIGATCSPIDFGLGVRKTYWYEEEK
ncbi:MAG: hypothetical protein GQ549_04370 [Gammaproteobacteria bacterium]|nr:hypothetical protein [Gammaproteobacteria bacterium]